MNARSARCPCGAKPRSNVGLCQRCYNRNLYQRNLGKRREQARAYYAANREQINARKRAWAAARRAESGRAPYQHKYVYAQPLVHVPVKGWGVRIPRPPTRIEDDA